VAPEWLGLRYLQDFFRQSEITGLYVSCALHYSMSEPAAEQNFKQHGLTAFSVDTPLSLRSLYNVVNPSEV